MGFSKIDLDAASNKNSIKEYSPLVKFWSEFFRNKGAVVGLIILIIVVLVAIFADQLMPYDPLALDPAYAMGTPQPPTLEHWLGTDELGRDIYSRAISGSRISISVGFVAVGIATLIGVVLGSLAGYKGGRCDNFIMRIADIFLALPIFYLILTVNVFVKPSIFNIMIIIGIFDWMGISRLVRGEFLRLKQMDFITASRSLGASGLSITVKHLLPNGVAPIIVAATIGIPAAILLESALSFLGLGVPPPYSSWGNMLFAGKQWLNQAWWMWVPPGTLIAVTVISFNFVGDGLRDAFDPLKKGR
jgi:peptide/nickel transport system permease protein